LVDIPLPIAVSFLPETWLSRAAILLLVVAIIAGLWWCLHHRRVNRYRRAAIAELDLILRDPNAAQQPAATIDALALLVRRTALAVCPRERIVSLTGSEWLNFLDRSYDGRQFSQGPGRILGAPLYEHRQFAPADVGSLGDLVRQWIHKHHV
jgi:Ca-activated chloride channel family protein